ncbi:MAG: DNA adenine methylase, partial [Planctomycetes bacterium]|nr:DNA adenine methylase [Planctomycetota bacterium]
AVWQSVLDGHAGWLAKKILEFDLTRESVIQEISEKNVCIKEKAFQTILKNRTFHGGILADGSGFLKHGENGKGIRSRWYPATIAKRFDNLKLVADRIVFRQEDGFKVMQESSQRTDVVFFIDPPYTAGGKKAGKRLYRHFCIDHERLFSLCQSIKGDFLMTYDNADEVKAMARAHGFQMRLIPMKNTHHAAMEELVIGKNLSWMDRYPAVHEPLAEYKVNGKKKGNSNKSLKTDVAILPPRRLV